MFINDLFKLKQSIIGIRIKTNLVYILLIIFAFFPIYLQAQKRLIIEHTPKDKISDFCITNDFIHLISNNFVLFKYDLNGNLIKKMKISQNISKKDQFGLLNLPHISCWKDDIYIHDRVNNINLYNGKLDFIKSLPIVPLGGHILVANNKIIYTQYKDNIARIYYYDLNTKKNVYITNANKEKDLNYRFLTKALTYKNKYYLYLTSMGLPVKDIVFVFNSKFNPIKINREDMLFTLFANPDHGKLIYEKGNIFFEKSTMKWEEDKQKRTFATSLHRYDIRNNKIKKIINLNDMIINDFFINNHIIYYLSTGGIYRHCFD